MYGLDMEDPRLISAVKQAILPPAKREEPYYLEVDEAVYFSGVKQDQILEKVFKKMVSYFIFKLRSKNFFT